MFVDTFIRRPILATVCSLVIVLAGALAIPTMPIAQAINGVEGMRYMSSSSTNSGVSQIIVTFDVTRDPDIAAVDVQNRVNQALGRLPGEVRQTGIIVQKAANNFIMAVGAFGDRGQYDSLFLSNYLDVYV